MSELTPQQLTPPIGVRGRGHTLPRSSRQFIKDKDGPKKGLDGPEIESDVPEIERDVPERRGSEDSEVDTTDGQHVNIDCCCSGSGQKIMAGTRRESVRLVGLLVIVLASIVCIGLDVDRQFFTNIVTLILGLLMKSPIEVAKERERI